MGGPLSKSVEKQCVFTAFRQMLFKIIMFYSYSEISQSSMSDQVAEEGWPPMGDQDHSERPDQHKWTPTNSEMYAKPLRFIVLLAHT